MFPKPNRLTKSREIREVLRKGGGVKRSTLLLKAGAPVSPPKFAVVVGRKVSKRSTVRNKIRRRIREALRRELGTTKRGSYVVLALPGSANLGFQDICNALRQALQQIRNSHD
ncbi:MAG: ribonuclease P protein component [Parcubacteria group bacterium]|nr:ribonuclease P protein component [Parcubacteria group bacterium]